MKGNSQPTTPRGGQRATPIVVDVGGNRVSPGIGSLPLYQVPTVSHEGIQGTFLLLEWETVPMEELELEMKKSTGYHAIKDL